MRLKSDSSRLSQSRLSHVGRAKSMAGRLVVCTIADFVTGIMTITQNDNISSK